MVRRFSIAPMMACTDKHYRYFARIMTKKTLLYTEMITQDAILHGDQKRLLDYNSEEHPIALQVGGSDPKKLAQCAKIAEEYGYDEINLNVGCPSDRVQSGSIGACLMKQPGLVAQCVEAMKNAVNIPVTVKTRIGVDDRDSYELLVKFVIAQKNAGIDALIVHARKAWLKGLSPKENRTVPPLQYETVYQLKNDFPNLEIIINGGIDSIADSKKHLQIVDGVMLGRAAYYDSYLLANVDQEIFGEQQLPLTREEVYDQFKPYLNTILAGGVKKVSVARHILGLYKGQPGAKKWRTDVTS